MAQPTGTARFQKNADAAATINDWVTVDEFCERFPNIPENDRLALAEYLKAGK